jgi:tetratricopeptide (TPR) repeat protein
MPFGKKSDQGGLIIDFDSVYRELINPAIKSAELDPVRADEEIVGGIIHKPMFERLVLCEFVVADLTNANANVFYELGVRHAVRPYSTVLLYAKNTMQLPFDVNSLRAIPYTLDASGKPQADNINMVKEIVTQRLVESKNPRTDSPLYQLLEGFPDIQHLKTDVFRERVQYSEDLKQQLSKIRKSNDIQKLTNFISSLGDMNNQDYGVIVDIFLSYRALARQKEDWKEMVTFVKKMPIPLSSTPLIQEQYALALNRAGESEEAEKTLLELIDKKGPSSETYGLLGRVHKDAWESSYKNKKMTLAKGYLDKAIETYTKGFQTDWRDAYPGINALTLIAIRDPTDPLLKRLYPVVLYAVERKISKGKADYWDYATLLELYVIDNNEQLAKESLSKALPLLREKWEAETTLRNISFIVESKEKSGYPLEWIEEILIEFRSAIS